MKRFIYILTLFVLCACTQELQLDEVQVKNSIVLNINNSTLETKALVAGTSNENKIETLDCFFYTNAATDETSAVHYAHFDPDVTKQAKIYLYLTEAEFSTIFPNNSTSCKVYVIANLTLPEGKTLSAKSTIAQLKGIEIEAAEFANVVGGPDIYSLNPPQKFVMHGSGNATVSNGSASGDIELIRSASKVTLNLKVPEYIEVDVVGDDGQVLRTERWEPNFTNITDPTEMQVSFHNGVKNDLLDSTNEVEEQDYFETYKATSFTHKETITNDEGIKEHLYSCDAVFYSYSTEWKQGDTNAPYFNLVVPWERVSNNVADNNDTETKAGEITDLHPYYYQVQINPVNRKLESNHWYDLTLNIGVLGSTIEAEPEQITDCWFYVINWTRIDTIFEGNFEEIYLSQWKYFIVNENRVEMNNVTTGVVTYEASHPIAWELEWPGMQEGFDKLEVYNTKSYAAYFINCRSRDPEAVELNGAGEPGTFTNPGNNKIVYSYEVGSNRKVFSPVYVHLKVWLDVNDNDTLDDGEEDFVEYITFIYYPSMYIVPDPSTRYSIYVNGTRSNSSSSNDVVRLGGENLGNASGIRNPDNKDVDYSMYTINVTRFDNQNDSFIGADGVSHKYIIGDPRIRREDIALNVGLNSTGYYQAPAIDYVSEQLQYTSGNRGLTFYYPTAYDDNSFQIIAPKFRITSFNNASYGVVSPKGAALRCATLQEDGFPAGRWRLPTIAELQYIVMLQRLEVIQDIFTPGGGDGIGNVGSKYYSSSYSDDGNSRIAIALDRDDDAFFMNRMQGSVRCVYDEWYWGAERQAKPNTGDDKDQMGHEYLFTWGDKEIIW